MVKATQTAPTPKTTRSNVRTGCIVCRIRKVKCDEARPQCVRCTSTGRTCDGYTTPPPIQKRKSSSKFGSTQKGLSVYTPSLRFSSTDKEARSIGYFESWAAKAASWSFEPEFWGYAVLRLSFTEPAVHHALVAMASLQETFELRNTSSGSSKIEEIKTSNVFAFQQYTRAVGLLANIASAGPPSTEGVLVSCILFVLIEFLRGSNETALFHLGGGLQIFRDLKQGSSQMGIDPSLGRLFRRIHTQARLHGSPASNFNSSVSVTATDAVNDLPQRFSTISEVGDSLETVLDLAYSFMRRMYDHSWVASIMKLHPFPDSRSIEATVHGHMGRLQEWQRAFKSFKNSFKPKPVTVMIQLELKYRTTAVVLKTLLETSEMAFDRYKADFEHMLVLCETLMRRVCGERPCMLCFDLGVVAPLGLVAMKCRYLIIRKRAIELLKQAPDRDGIWDRDSCVEFAEWKLQVEEAGRGDVPEAEPLPDMARIHSERSRSKVLGGQWVTVVSYKRGDMDRAGENEFEQAVTTLSPLVGEVL